MSRVCKLRYDLVRFSILCPYSGQLAKTEAELAPLEAKQKEIEWRAHRAARRWAWAGVAFLGLQGALVARLTWYEFSWDIMEVRDPRCSSVLLVCPLRLCLHLLFSALLSSSFLPYLVSGNGLWIAS